MLYLRGGSSKASTWILEFPKLQHEQTKQGKTKVTDSFTEGNPQLSFHWKIAHKAVIILTLWSNTFQIIWLDVSNVTRKVCCDIRNVNSKYLKCIASQCSYYHSLVYCFAYETSMAEEQESLCNSFCAVWAGSIESRENLWEIKDLPRFNKTSLDFGFLQKCTHVFWVNMGR